jgi:site-specific recombinase XerD
MTALKQKYIRDLAIRGKAERTQHSYTSFVRDLAKYHRQSPDLLSYDQVADWLFHLVQERKLSNSSVNIAVNAVRFLYQTTLGRDTAELFAKVPRIKRETKRAQAYAVSELEAILAAPAQPRDRAFLMTVYACGLRLSEAIHLKIGDIDKARMQLRVRRGKGAKERVLPLSPRLLEELRDYWRKERAGKQGHDCPWLFLGTAPGEPMHRSTGQNIYYRAVKKSGVRRKGGIHVLRHSFATHLIESGWELPDIQRMLGHTSLLTTARYLHITAQRRAKVRSPFDLIDTRKVPNPQGQPPRST